MWTLNKKAISLSECDIYLYICAWEKTKKTSIKNIQKIRRAVKKKNNQ